MVARLLKGVYNNWPPQPRYATTWDIDVVTRHLITMGCNESLTLKLLSHKLVILMALIEASRTSELKALDIRFRTYKPDGVAFKLASLTKKRTPGLPPKELFFGAFPNNKQLCVVECLKEYEIRTKELRNSDPGAKPLFLSYVRPHKPVTSQRLAHWVKDVLAEAGVDKSFKAHSVRGASTSAAMLKVSPCLRYSALLIGVQNRPLGDSITGKPGALNTCRKFSRLRTPDLSVRFRDFVPNYIVLVDMLFPKGCMFSLGFEIYQWNTQRVSRSIITNLTRARRARS